MQSVRWLAVALVACGGPPRPPPKPPAPDPQQLALDRHRDITALADVARRMRGNCDGLAAELRPLVARMRTHAADVQRATADPARAKQVTTALHAYDTTDRGLDEQVGGDLAQTYLGCKQNRALLELIDQIPTE